MLWAGVIVLLVAIMLAANGQFSKTAFGIGLGLLIAWLLSDREPSSDETPNAPLKDEDSARSKEALTESSTEVDLSNFPEFLRKLAAQITRGFGDAEIARLVSRAKELPHSREFQTDLQVVFRGNTTPLRIQLFKDDVESIGIALFTSKELADHFDREMDEFFSRRGM